ncbi:GNAT family N-acetyltransferase [Glycomyces sp. NPDC047010]|uniref:GNAT family N-acetyltransferase n=1 Tax=Glycomyces sp. NPDC047010 TaxID=3155023 RepID=UPI0033D3DD57
MLTARARSLWQTVASAPVTFPATGVQVVASPGSRMCPPGWAGIVALDGSAIATVPAAHAVAPVQHALDGIAAASLTEPAALRAVLPVGTVLGPATLAYVSPETFIPAETGAVERLAPGHPDLKALLESANTDDADESGIDEITSAAFTVREHGKVVAAAGYRSWPAATAHLCVLTAEAARGRGLAKLVASAAVDDALAASLLPQWRARPAASRRVARALGFRELGSQLSVALDLDRLTAPDRA